MTIENLATHRSSVADIAAVISGIADGELFLPQRSRQTLPPVLRDAILRLIRSIQARTDASRSADHRDGLTALLSNSSFKQMTIERLARAERCHALLLVDLVEFRRVNDTRGYAAGDQLLALAASRISSVLDTIYLKAGGRGEPPLVGRIASDEFVALIDVEEIKDTEDYAAALINALREPFYISQRGIMIGSSIGIAMVPDHALSYDPLLRHAKLALQDAKTHGPNRVVMFDQAMADMAQQSAVLEVELRAALLDEQFELHFQPIVRVDGTTTQPIMEALIRWRHPTRGIIMPGDFIPLAESSGLICEMGRWVLPTAVRTIARWKDLGRPCSIAVNVSAQELAQRDFASFVEEWLTRTGADPQSLEIELTETAATTANKVVLDNLHQLSAIGVPLAIDDFGTGQSNFARLSQLPFNRLKIDQSLAREATSNAVQREVVLCIVQLGKALGHELVVEGIETGTEASLFTAMGCNLLQGFHYSQPLPEEAALQWIASASARGDIVAA